MTDLLPPQRVKFSRVGFGCWRNRWGSLCSLCRYPVLLSEVRYDWCRQLPWRRCPCTCRVFPLTEIKPILIAENNPALGRRSDKAVSSSGCETTSTLRSGDSAGEYCPSTSNPETLSAVEMDSFVSSIVCPLLPKNRYVWSPSSALTVSATNNAKEIIFYS